MHVHLFYGRWRRVERSALNGPLLGIISTMNTPESARRRSDFSYMSPILAITKFEIFINEFRLGLARVAMLDLISFEVPLLLWSCVE